MRWRTHYSNVITTGANQGGLYLSSMFVFRFMHPPLFIPWTEIRVQRTKGWLFENVTFTLDRELAIPMRIRREPAPGLSLRYSKPLMADEQRGTEGAVKERVKPKKQDPTLYKVVLLNDDYTTMEFVVQILETVFQQSPAEAFRVMMQVHVNGRGIAGVYPWEVAETKVATVTSLAREAGFPLRAELEES
jgi:ATP-dependent Clp protease adaptor protein ClpS